MNVDLNQMPFEKCSCGCPYWKERTVIKKVSALQAAMSEDQYYPVAYLACENCGKPHLPTTKIDVPMAAGKK